MNNEKLIAIEDKLKSLNERVENDIQLSGIVQKSIDASDQTQKINTILNVVVLMAAINFLLGISQILLLWGLAK
jgi:hypothetical protein